MSGLGVVVVLWVVFVFGLGIVVVLRLVNGLCVVVVVVFTKRGFVSVVFVFFSFPLLLLLKLNQKPIRIINKMVIVGKMICKIFFVGFCWRRLVVYSTFSIDVSSTMNNTMTDWIFGFEITRNNRKACFVNTTVKTFSKSWQSSHDFLWLLQMNFHAMTCFSSGLRWSEVCVRDNWLFFPPAKLSPRTPPSWP